MSETMTPAEVLAEAMEIAFSLGQTYWQQADSDSFKQKVKADATRWRFQELKQEALVAVAALVAELEADAKRGRFCYEKAEWHRFDGRTYLAIRVPDGSDLSCLALRRDALDATMKGPQHSEDQEENGDA